MTNPGLQYKLICLYNILYCNLTRQTYKQRLCLFHPVDWFIYILKRITLYILWTSKYVPALFFLESLQIRKPNTPFSNAQAYRTSASIKALDKAIATPPDDDDFNQLFVLLSTLTNYVSGDKSILRLFWHTAWQIPAVNTLFGVNNLVIWWYVVLYLYCILWTSSTHAIQPVALFLIAYCPFYARTLCTPPG